MLRRFILTLIRFYQRAVSPVTPATCRFEPTCSEYARQAVERHGAGRGSWLAARRLVRCRPFGPHGYDPVPPVAVQDARGDHGRGIDALPHDGELMVTGEPSNG